jgi:succinoglycan biosynthesis protein ExoA
MSIHMTTVTPHRSDRRQEAAAGVLISVLVPIRNEARSIRRTLEQLVHQGYDPNRFEILVIDGGSTDGTREIVAEFAARMSNIRFFHNPRVWSSAARNIGICHARGEILVVVDGHCLLARDWLSAVEQCMVQSGADCLGRPQPLVTPEATAVGRAIGLARSSWLGHHPSSFIYSNVERFVPAISVAVAYRRRVFQQLGPFDESFDACEDVEFNHRVDAAGLRCFFSPRVAVRYESRTNLRGLFRQLTRYGQGRMRLLWKHHSTFSLGSFLPAMFVLGIMLGAAGSLFSSALAYAFLAVAALYLSVVLVASATASIKSRAGLGTALWMPLVFLTIHTAAGWGALSELVRGLFRKSPKPKEVPA